MTTLDLRSVARADAEPIKQLAIDAGMFTPEEVGQFDEMLAGFFDGSLADHHWLVAVTEPETTLVAAAYYAPEPFSDRMWNLYFIATDPDRQGSGAGTRLIEHIEQRLRASGPDVARTLIVDTSSLDAYAESRAFYARRGFTEEARIRDFYGPGDHKVTFWKSLTG